MVHGIEKLENFFIDQGLQNIPHVYCDFLTHLSGVYNILNQWNCSEEIALAGLFHSIYGTDNFNGFALSLYNREEIQRLIGRAAERFVYIYCAVSDQSFQSSVIYGDPSRLLDRFVQKPMVITEQEFEALLYIRLADAIDVESRLIAHYSGKKRYYLWLLSRSIFRRRDARFWKTVAEHFNEKVINSWSQVWRLF
jgi:hypothetical protein